jgi:phytoene dehydrogenase-like protein
VSRAEGAIGRGLNSGQDPGKARRAVEELLRAVIAGPGARTERALKQGPWAARGDFTAMLDALADTLAEAARVSTGHPVRQPLPEPLTSTRPVDALLAAQTRVLAAREAAQGNVNPQLLLAVLVEDLAEVL